MELEKVRSYPTPGYPTAKAFHELEKLTQYVPRRWRSNRLVEHVLLFTTLTGLDVRRTNTHPSKHIQSTEADANRFLQLHEGSPCPYTIHTDDMPDWHCPEDWERDVEEYRMAHPALAELSPKEATIALANWLKP